MNTFSDLSIFIDLAEKNRKYPANTAQGLRASLKVFGKELKPDEFNSLNLVEERIDEVFLDVLNANRDKYSIESLNTYKARFVKVLTDYKRYGVDPSKMQNWTVKARKPVEHNPQRHLTDSVEKDTPDVKQDASVQTPSAHLPSPVHTVENSGLPMSANLSDNCHRLELALRPGIKAILVLPADLSAPEAETIKSILDSLKK